MSDKKNILYVVGSVLAIVLLGFWYLNFGKSAAVRNFPSAGTDIIAFGDSLVQGTGATSSGTNFVSLLSRKIGRPIINLGVSGNTTADGLARLAELDQYNPKVVLLLLGGNDHLRKVPIDVTFGNLGSIIQNLQSRGAVVLILGVKGNLFGDKFKPQFEKLRDTYHTAYVPDVLDGLFGKRQFMSDSVHPNDVGYAKIADRIYPELVKLLR